MYYVKRYYKKNLFFPFFLLTNKFITSFHPWIMRKTYHNAKLHLVVLADISWEFMQFNEMQFNDSSQGQ